MLGNKVFKVFKNEDLFFKFENVLDIEKNFIKEVES